jgi:hypothetical protein
MKHVAIAAVALLLAGLGVWLTLPAEGRVVSAPELQETTADSPTVEAPPAENEKPAADAERADRMKDLTRGSDLLESSYGLPEPRRDSSQKYPAPDATEDLAESPEPEPGRKNSAVGLGSAGSGAKPQRINPPTDPVPHLTWLAERQNREGFFTDGVTQDENVEPVASTMLTALAILANVSLGATHRDGPTRQVVRGAVLWSRKTQDNDGNFAAMEAVDPVLHHAVAAFAMAETYAITGDAVLKPIVDRAIEYLLKARGDLGAWGYQPEDANPNVVVTGWALLALQSAAHVNVDKRVLADASLWAASLGRSGFTAWSTAEDHMPGSDPAADTLMADAVFVLALHQGGYATAGDGTVELVLQRLLNSRVQWDGRTNDLMAWYFISHALQAVAPERAPDWNANTLQQVKDAAQHEMDGDKLIRTSWSSTDYWSGRFGQVYTTAMASLVLARCTSTND